VRNTRTFLQPYVEIIGQKHVPLIHCLKIVTNKTSSGMSEYLYINCCNVKKQLICKGVVVVVVVVGGGGGGGSSDMVAMLWFHNLCAYGLLNLFIFWLPYLFFFFFSFLGMHCGSPGPIIKRACLVIRGNMGLTDSDLYLSYFSSLVLQCFSKYITVAGP
jgi:hypothetical protein